MINEWQTLWCNNVYERDPLIRQEGPERMNGQGQLGPLTSLSLSDTIFQQQTQRAAQNNNKHDQKHNIIQKASTL